MITRATLLNNKKTFVFYCAKFLPITEMKRGSNLGSVATEFQRSYYRDGMNSGVSE